MRRVTISDVQMLAGEVARAAKSAGFPDTSRYVMSGGSASAGVAFRLMIRDPVSGGQSSPAFLSDGYLGMTAREAWETLATVRRVLWAVAERK